MTPVGPHGPGPAAAGPAGAGGPVDDVGAGPGDADVARQAEALARAVAVMDRLRSPGGCPWDARQTHESLLPYAVEEVHELVEAVEAGDRAGVREELGDVLLQVLFHARVAAEDPDDPFDVADVADGLVAKLVRRHPHVFAAADEDELDAAAVHERWERLKRAEKPTRTSALDGVPPSMGALARAQKLVAKADRAHLLARAPLPPPPFPSPSPSPDASSTPRPSDASTTPRPSDALPTTPPSSSRAAPRPGAAAADVIGDALLGLVAAAHRAGVDAEAALRRATATWESAARHTEP